MRLFTSCDALECVSGTDLSVPVAVAVTMVGCGAPGVGHRHRQGGHPGAGAGGACFHPQVGYQQGARPCPADSIALAQLCGCAEISHHQ